MKKLLKLLIPTLALVLGGATVAQALDFEVGYRSQLNQGQGLAGNAYVETRMSLPLADMGGGVTLWLLPEMAFGFAGEGGATDFEGRVQLVADLPHFSLFGSAGRSFSDANAPVELLVGGRFGVALSDGVAVDLEAGYRLFLASEDGRGFYALARLNLALAQLDSVDIWVLPEVSFDMSGPDLATDLRLQLLAELPDVTLVLDVNAPLETSSGFGFGAVEFGLGARFGIQL